MHVTDMFAVFYIRKTIILANVTKIKRSPIKDGLQYGDINRPFKCGVLMSKQICYTLFSIKTTLLTRYKTEKSCKGGVNHNITRGASAYSGSPYKMSHNQL